jgi:hypothetical protein
MDQEQVVILIMYAVLIILFIARTVWMVVKWVKATHKQRVRLFVTQGIQFVLILIVIIITGLNLIRLGP